jgi:hypothetical protein
MLGWVRLKKYCADRGETHDAVVKRIRSGHWLNGVHARKPEGSAELWVNLDAVSDWCAGVTPVHDHGRRISRVSETPAALRAEMDRLVAHAAYLQSRIDDAPIAVVDADTLA